MDEVVTKERINDAILALKSIGYIHEGNLGISGREAFAYKGKEHLQFLLKVWRQFRLIHNLKLLVKVRSLIYLHLLTVLLV